MMKKLLFLSLLLAFGLAGFSQTNTFNGNTDNFWNTATNWTLGVPTAAHDVVIPLGEECVIAINTTNYANSIEVLGKLTMNPGEDDATLTVGPTPTNASENSKTSQAVLKEEDVDLADKNK